MRISSNYTWIYLATSLVLSVDADDVFACSQEMVLRRPTEPGAGEVKGRPPPTPAFIVLLLPTLALPPGLVPIPITNNATGSFIRKGSTQNKARHTSRIEKHGSLKKPWLANIRNWPVLFCFVLFFCKLNQRKKNKRNREH